MQTGGFSFPSQKWNVNQKGHIQESYGGGWYGVKVGYREHPLVAKASDDKQPMNHGDQVEVVHMDGDQNIGVILKERGHGKPPAQGTVIPDDDVGPEPVFVPGLWTQQRGFWWIPNHNREEIPRLSLIPPTQNTYTNETMYVFLQPSFSGMDTVILFQHEIDYSFTWQVKRDGDVFVNMPSGGNPPLGVPDCYIESVAYIFSDSFNPSGGAVPNGGYRGMLLKDVDFSGSVWTASYKTEILNKTLQYIRPDEIMDAARKTIPFKGLVLFPDGSNQNLSVLTPHFEVEGQNIINESAQDSITFVEDGEESAPEFQREGQFFTLEHEPNDTPVLHDYNIPSEYTNLLFNDLIVDQIDGATFGVKILMGSGRWMHFYYGYRSEEQGFSDEQTVDGSSQIIRVKPREIQNTSVAGDIEVPVYEITSINQVSINGFSFPVDELATFSGDEITITATLNPGDIVSFDVNGYEIVNDDMMIVTDNDQSDFVVDHNISGEGSLYRINFLNQGVSGPDSGDDQDYAKLAHVIPGTNTVRLYMFWPAGHDISVDYHYPVVTGDYYKTSEMRIYEIGGNFSGQRVLKTPIPEYTLNPKLDCNNTDSAGDRETGEGLGVYTEGALFLEPNTKTYTIAGPNGIIWRSRALLTEPAPGLAEPNVHYTFTPWTEESLSMDWYNTNPNYSDDNPPPEVLIHNREDCSRNFSSGGNYGLQGSWNRYGGVLGDSTQVLRLWKRHTTTYVWSNHKNIELNKLLPDDISTAGQVRIQAMGRTDYYDRANSNFQFSYNQFMSGRWPISKNYKAWIVAAPFVVEDFQADIDAYYLHDPNDRGWKDAGITFNAIDPNSGEILSQYTIRPSKDPEDVIEIFEDPQHDLEVLKESNNASLAESIDKYYNYNPYYYGDNPEHELKPPYDGQNTVIASSRWATVPWDSGEIFALYSRNTGIGEEVDRVLGYPGIPMFPAVSKGNTFTIETMFNSFVPWPGYQGPDTMSQLNKNGEPNLSMDEDGNIYFTLYMPFWQRWQDSYVGGVDMEFVQRTYSESFAGTSSNQSFFRVPVFFNGNLSTGADVEAYFNGSPTGHNYPGFDSGFLVPYTAENVYIPGTFVGYVDGTANPDTGFPGIPIFDYPPGTITVKWYQPTVGPFTEILRPAGPFEYPSFLGFQATPMPIKGMAISNQEVDWAKEYRVVGIPYLFKLHFDQDSGQITEKWRKDIGQRCNFPSNTFTRFGEDYPTIPLSNTSDAMANWTIACGRYIFVIKDGEYSNPNGTSGSDFRVRKVVLYIFKNQDTEPELFKSLVIPNTEISVNTALYYTAFATADIDDNGREHLFLQMSNSRANSILMPLDEGEDPDIQSQPYHASGGEPDFPQYRYDAASMARAGVRYYWLDNDNNVKRKTILEG